MFHWIAMKFHQVILVMIFITIWNVFKEFSAVKIESLGSCCSFSISKFQCYFLKITQDQGHLRP